MKWLKKKKNYSKKNHGTTVKFLLWKRKSTICGKYWHFNTTFKAMCNANIHHCQKKETCWCPWKDYWPSFTVQEFNYTKIYEIWANVLSSIRFLCSYYNSIFMKRMDAFHWDKYIWSCCYVSGAFAWIQNKDSVTDYISEFKCSMTLLVYSKIIVAIRNFSLCCN